MRFLPPLANKPPKSILIIDDQDRNIFALSATLKARGFSVVSASGSRAVYGILARPELIDMMMPEMDGYEAVSPLKQDNRYKHIPVVAVTSQATAGDREECMDTGVDASLAKPIDVDALLELLDTFT